MKKPFKGTILSKILYCSFVAVLSLLIFLIGIGLFSLFVSFVIKTYNWSDYIKKLPNWNYIGFACLSMFVIANFALFQAEITIEKYWSRLVALFDIKKAIFAIVISMLICLSTIYFGFSMYVLWIYNEFWI